MKRILSIKKYKNKNGFTIVRVLDKTVVKDGLVLISFIGDVEIKDNELMQDALDYVNVINRVGGSSLVWN